MGDGRQSGYRGDEDLADALHGPAVSTDGAIVLFDGTSGTAAKDSGVTLAELQSDIAAAVSPKRLYARISVGI